MLTIAISMLLSASTIQPGERQWVQDLLASPRAVKIAKRQPVPSAKNEDRRKPSAPQVAATVSDENHVLTNWRAGLDLSNTVASAAGVLLNEGRSQDAYEKIFSFRRERPDLACYNNHFAAECALVSGHFGEAYDILVPVVADRSESSPAAILALSAASAGLGQVYPGQAEYCRDQVIAGLRERFVHDGLDTRLAGRSDAQAIGAMSCLALGINYGMTPYLEMALGLDPQNVVAANQLIERYAAQARTPDVRRIASGMLKSLPPGDAHRAAYERALAEAN